MIYDLSHPLIDRSGRILSDASGAATIASAVVNALDTLTTNSDRPNETLSGREKMRRYELGCRILADAAAVNLSLEEAALCKTLAGEGYGPLIVGQVWAALERISHPGGINLSAIAALNPEPAREFGS